jgi:hypothetical protein
MKYLKLFSLCLLVLFSSRAMASGGYDKGQQITLVLPASPHVRVVFGAEKLAKALTDAGYTVQVALKSALPSSQGVIVIGKINDELVKKASAAYKMAPGKMPGKEGFTINAISQGKWIIGGADESGVLYGCIELAGIVKEKRLLPETISVTDQPEMVLRGSCIGIQKTTYLPGRTVYEYPYTPETFPWFYDKKHWIQ